MKIGVFDSGIGGLSVANAIEKVLPEHDIIFRNDQVHVPYGDKALPQIHDYVLPILKSLINEGCQVIVVACNTVTTNLIVDLRHELVVPLVAVEPMVKPAAAQTVSKIIAVCATPNTLASRRYQELKRLYTSDIRVLEPDCSDWSSLIESNKLEQIQIAERLHGVLDNGADVIVLACTHYHWIERDIQAICADRAVVLQPEAALIRQLQLVIKQIS